MSLPSVLVFDCGAAHLSGGRFQCAKDEKLTLVAHATVPLEGEFDNDTSWLNAIAYAAGQLRSQLGESDSECVVSVPGHLALTKFVKTPAVERSKRDRIVQFEAAQNIPYPLEEVAWDHAEVADDGVEVELMLSAVKSVVLDELCAGFAQAGLEVVRIEPAGLAGMRTWRDSPGRTTETSLIVDMGSRSTQLEFVNRDKFFMRTLPFGGNLSAQIEASGGLAKRLGAELTRSIFSYSRHPDAVSPEEIILSGSGSRLPGLAQQLSETLALPVRRLEMPIDLDLDVSRIDDDSLVVLAGLARGYFKTEGMAMNLLPPERQSEQRKRRVRPWWLAGAALLLLALLPPIAYLQLATSRLETRNRTMDRELSPLIKWDLRNRHNLERLDELRSRAGILRGILVRRDRWAFLLADLQNRLESVGDVWLERLVVLPVSPLSSDTKEGSPLRLKLSGKLLDTENPTAKASAASYARVKQLLKSFAESKYVQVVGDERFDNAQPGILKFELTLVINQEESW